MILHAAGKKEHQGTILFEIQCLPGRTASQTRVNDPKRTTFIQATGATGF